jgi:hypothetical protein
MSKKTERRGVIRITTELWHELLGLPEGVRIVDAAVEVNAYSGWQDRPAKALIFLIKGEGLPEVPLRERSPAITPVYESAPDAKNKRFVRFERIDGERREE